MNVDLDQFSGLKDAQEQGLAVAIKAPDGITDLGLTIVIAGPDSDRQRVARQKQVNRRLAKRNPGPLTAEEAETSSLEVLAESVISWSPDPVLGGKKLACTVENVTTVLRAHPFIREQIDQAAGARADFLKR